MVKPSHQLRCLNPFGSCLLLQLTMIMRSSKWMSKLHSLMRIYPSQVLIYKGNINVLRLVCRLTDDLISQVMDIRYQVNIWVYIREYVLDWLAMRMFHGLLYECHKHSHRTIGINNPLTWSYYDSLYKELCTLVSTNVTCNKVDYKVVHWVCNKLHRGMRVI